MRGSGAQPSSGGTRLAVVSLCLACTCGGALAVESTPATLPAASLVSKDAGRPLTNGTAALSSALGTNAWPLEVAHAVMVTVELDFGPQPPTIAQALTQVERWHKPDDGKGRTFAILDAYGAPTESGKLHISMHVSAEKPGDGALVFKRTGEVLWRAHIVQGTSSPSDVFAKKGLIILMDDGAGHTVAIDGSKNPRSILEATVKESGGLVRDFWPEGQEREMSFLYSACGCPVKVKALRSGDRTVRTSDLPVIFPDDPGAAAVIKKLMSWD